MNKNPFVKSLKKIRKNPLLSVIVVTAIAFSFIAGNVSQQVIKIKTKNSAVAAIEENKEPDLAAIQKTVLPEEGYVFDVKWGDLGKRLVEDGVIDKKKLAQAVSGTDELPAELDKYFNGSAQKIEVNSGNAHFWVDVLWGLGLANKNEILEGGPMVERGQTANFASTGGYTLGKQDPMVYYSKYSYITLTSDQQALVKEIAEGVYRPCCGNSTAFPDCNHGMAALGLIELMVSQGFSKEEIYKTVLVFNSYWFPQTYLDIAYHFEKNNRSFTDVPASEILSKTFSSAMGYQAVKKQIGTVEWPGFGSSGCGA
ncbi:MAG: hypothetical protein C4584_02390 [Armatimonadetes bacterium]|nr:MAG: hypothetical protein C4584_02390 [Armatimonadota bacterium]